MGAVDPVGGRGGRARDPVQQDRVESRGAVELGGDAVCRGVVGLRVSFELDAVIAVGHDAQLPACHIDAIYKASILSVLVFDVHATYKSG